LFLSLVDACRLPVPSVMRRSRHDKVRSAQIELHTHTQTHIENSDTDTFKIKRYRYIDTSARSEFTTRVAAQHAEGLQ